MTPGDDAYYTLVERLATVTNDIATPGQFLVEAFPSLRKLPSWFPGARFKRVAAAWRAESISIRDQLYASAKEAMVSALHCVLECASLTSGVPRGRSRVG